MAVNEYCIHQKKKKTRAKDNMVVNNGPEWTVEYPTTNSQGRRDNSRDPRNVFAKYKKRKPHRGGNNNTTLL